MTSSPVRLFELDFVWTSSPALVGKSSRQMKTWKMEMSIKIGSPFTPPFVFAPAKLSADERVFDEEHLEDVTGGAGQQGQLGLMCHKKLNRQIIILTFSLFCIHKGWEATGKQCELSSIIFSSVLCFLFSLWFYCFSLLESSGKTMKGESLVGVMAKLSRILHSLLFSIGIITKISSPASASLQKHQNIVGNPFLLVLQAPPYLTT